MSNDEIYTTQKPFTPTSSFTLSDSHTVMPPSMAAETLDHTHSAESAIKTNTLAVLECEGHHIKPETVKPAEQSCPVVSTQARRVSTLIAKSTIAVSTSSAATSTITKEEFIAAVNKAVDENCSAGLTKLEELTKLLTPENQNALKPLLTKLLWEEVDKGHLESAGILVNILIKIGADMAFQDETQKMPLIMYAASKRNIKAVKLLIDKAVQNDSNSLFAKLLNVRDSYGNTLFTLLADNFNVDILDELIQTCIKKNDIKLLQHCLKAKNIMGQSPLMLAVYKGDKDTVNLLTKTAADHKFLAELLDVRDLNGDTVFTRAALDGLEALIQSLTEAGIDFKEHLNDRNNQGQSFLMLEAASSSAEGIEWLIAEAVRIAEADQIDPKVFLDTLLNAQDNNGDTVFTFAARNGETMFQALIQALKNAGINPDAYLHEKNRQASLLLAVEAGDLETVRGVLEGDKTDINMSERDRNGDTALMQAIKQEKWDIVKMLIEHASNPSDIDQSVLLLAASKKDIDIEIIRLLIKKAIQIDSNNSNHELLPQLLNACDKDYNKIFMLAGMNERTDILKELIQALKTAGMDAREYLSNTNNQSQSLLFLLFAAGKIDVINFLIDTFEQVDSNNSNHELVTQLLNARDKDGNTIFMLAAMHGRNGILEALIRACNALICDDYLYGKNYNGQSLLMLAAINGNIETINFLIEQACKFEESDTVINKFFNDCDKNKNTVFMLAVMNGRTDVLEALIQASLKQVNGQADINKIKGLLKKCLNIPNNNGETPLIVAALKGNKEMVKLLLEGGADPNARDRNFPPLMHAATKLEWEVVEMLIERGANPADIHQALAWAIIQMNKKTASELMKHGANLDKANQIIEIKDLAMIWGLTGYYPIEDENGNKTILRLEGSDQVYMLDILLNYIKNFKSENLSHLNLNVEKIQKSLANALHDESYINSNTIEKIKSGELLPLSLLGGSEGSEGHAVSLYICNTKNGMELVICNRGAGQADLAVKRYSLDQSSINETMIRNLTKNYPSMEEFNGMISEMIEPKNLQPGLKPPLSRIKGQDGGLSLAPQKVGNCPIASPKAQFAFILRVFSPDISEPRNEVENRNEAELRDEAGREVYKEFTAWMRAQELEKFIRFNSDARLILPIMKKYINKLQITNDQKKSMLNFIREMESSEVSPEKRKSAMSQLISMFREARLEKAGEVIKRAGMQKIGNLLENWLLFESLEIPQACRCINKEDARERANSPPPPEYPPYFVWITDENDPPTGKFGVWPKNKPLPHIFDQQQFITLINAEHDQEGRPNMDIFYANSDKIQEDLRWPLE